MDLSFGWTWPAVAAREKTRTRRFWKEVHARKFRQGMIVNGIDKDRRAGGRPFCTIEILVAPYLQPLSEMPDSDYEAEGFAYLDAHRYLIPRSMPITVTREGFNAWRQGGGTPYVVEFKIIELFPHAHKELMFLNGELPMNDYWDRLLWAIKKRMGTSGLTDEQILTKARDCYVKWQLYPEGIRDHRLGEEAMSDWLLSRIYDEIHHGPECGDIQMER